MWVQFKEAEQHVDEMKKFSRTAHQKGATDIALCCIPASFAVRRWFGRVIESGWFEAVMMIAIMASSWCLTYPAGTEPNSIEILGHVCTVVFAFEAVIKIVALNFAIYMQDVWNVLDFTVMLGAVAELVMGSENLGTLKIVRLLRLFRALRFIKHIGSLKLLVKVLVGCMPTVLATVAIVLIIYVCFGILGLYMFSGLFYNCSCYSESSGGCTADYANEICKQMQNAYRPDSGQYPYTLPVENGQENLNGSWTASNLTLETHHLPFSGCGDCCDGGMHEDFKTQKCLDQVKLTVQALSSNTVGWTNPAYNFDDIGSAVKTMFYMSTTEGWVDIMHSGMDVADRTGLPPVKDNQMYFALYFLAFQMVGAAFSMSLFTGVLVNYFAESSGSGVLTKKQQEWVHAKLMVHGAHSITHNPAESGIRMYAHQLYRWRFYELMVSCVILFNVSLILLERFPQRSFLESTESPLNLACLIFFTFEIFLGITATSLRAYVRHAWNKFDTVVVIFSWLAFIVEQFPSVNVGINVQALRATRIIRLLTLFKGNRSLNAL